MRYHLDGMTARTRKNRRSARRVYRWERLDDSELLKVRFCDLRLPLRNSLIWPEIERLYRELERRGLRLRPHMWLSTEWFSPDGVPGIAVPFFVAHPRLVRIERRMKGEVEGGNRLWRMRILRHEAGHAIDTAFRLRRRADWREVFGFASSPYPGKYSVRPNSRAYVQHIGHWYAQSHPTEDFAETFAVWLQPKARWRREYAGWPALEKLEFVDSLMAEIAGHRPLNRDRSVVAPLAENGRTIGEHYNREMAFQDPVDRRYDSWLKRAFTSRARRPTGVPAGQYIRERRPQLRRTLTRRLGMSQYLAEHAIERIRQRVRQLDLVLRGRRRESFRPLVRLHERVVLDVLRRNREKYVL
jgi:Putative zinc-binding metallo-peptidase